MIILTSGIAFGIHYNVSDIDIYIGPFIVVVKTKYHHDFVDRINAGTWPKGWVWIVKHSKGW